MKIKILLLIVIFTVSVKIDAQTTAKKGQTSEENWKILETATAQELFGNYEMAIENYKTFISNVYDQDLKHSAYGNLGYCLSQTTKYQEAIPFLTKYINYFNPNENVIFRIDKVNTSNQYIGKYYIQRGFCKAKLEDFNGAETDLTKGINFIEMIMKSNTYKQDWNYDKLGFGYLMRGLSKMRMNKGIIFCEDLRKSIDLGKTEAIELVKNYCN